MKFGRYLRDSLIPEWRKAYIDYRGLKKLIKRISEQEHDELLPPPGSGSAPPSRPGGRYGATDVGLSLGEQGKGKGASSSEETEGEGLGVRTHTPKQQEERRRESVGTDGTLRDVGEFGGAAPVMGGDGRLVPPSAAGAGAWEGNGNGKGKGADLDLDRVGEEDEEQPAQPSNRSGRSVFRSGGSRKSRSGQRAPPWNPNRSPICCAPSPRSSGPTLTSWTGSWTR
ncbi:hypothetical protein CALVIDRAFT_350582 [Calocera viscosa TUFC12733]|uniref:SPX domain-containing protein n=1 Tax=Calocera viscosa (strain TUFC12733) TaxID=1330018 RepID=A0A167QB65_CALVF|nr:hypothetical protein CALVIDRAFT_350582 [Calocera viscosa TUFC12733]